MKKIRIEVTNPTGKKHYITVPNTHVLAIGGDKNLKKFQGTLNIELESFLLDKQFFCDSCVDKFIRNWKGILIDSKSFKVGKIPFWVVYQTSDILPQDYTKSEFLKLVRKLTCPTCSRHIKDNFWTYDIPVDIEDFNEFEPQIRDLSNLSKRAPFMVLMTPFAQKVLRTIKKISKITKGQLIEYPVYKCRKLDKRKKIFNVKDSGAVPDSSVPEGRFNHAGYGFLYLGTTEELCFKEVGESRKKTVSMAKIKLLRKLRLLDLTKIDSYHDKIYKIMMASSLLVNPRGGNDWDKPGYTFTRFVADCALYSNLDGIKYRSIHSKKEYNIVVFKDKLFENQPWDYTYRIEEVYRYKLSNIRIKK